MDQHRGLEQAARAKPAAPSGRARRPPPPARTNVRGRAGAWRLSAAATARIPRRQDALRERDVLGQRGIALERDRHVRAGVIERAVVALLLCEREQERMRVRRVAVPDRKRSAAGAPPWSLSAHAMRESPSAWVSRELGLREQLCERLRGRSRVTRFKAENPCL